MAAARTVISGSNGDGPIIGNVFEGLKFFLVQRLPSRLRFVGDIEANGGRVVKLENQADFVIADHARKDAPGGSYSYTLIEAAIRDGEMPNPGDHAAGRPAGEVRSAGSGVPGKKTRNPFTAEQDRILWQWVQPFESKGGSVAGNEIYKKLEAAYPQHTYQAWRDRYLKKLRGRPPPPGAEVTVPANPPPSPPEDNAEQAPAAKPGKRKVSFKPEPEPEARPQHGPLGVFSEEDFDSLYENAKDIENIDPEVTEGAWDAWAQSHPPQSATEWRRFYWAKVRPVFLAQEQENGDDDSGGPPVELVPADAERASPSQKERQEPSRSPVKRKRDQSKSPGQDSPRSSKRRAVSPPVKDRSPSTRPNAHLQPRVEDASSGDEKPTARMDQGTAQRQPPASNGGSKRQTPAARSELPVEDAQQAKADAQVPLQEVMPPEAVQDSHDADQILTSEANRIAESQLFGKIADATSVAGDPAASESLQTSEINHSADVQTQNETANLETQLPSASTRRDEQQVSTTSKPGNPAPNATDKMLEALKNFRGQSRSANVEDPREEDRAHAEWTQVEDEVVLKGIRRKWTAKMVIDNLPSHSGRTASAVRSRRLLLIEQKETKEPGSRKFRDQFAWSKPEDDVILRGMRLQWKARKILANLPEPSNRTASSVRNRRAALREKYGDKLLILNDDDESDSTEGSQLGSTENEEADEPAEDANEDADEDSFVEVVAPNAEEPLQSQDSGRRSNSDTSASHPLTAANLAQHKKSLMPRGADLEEDDEEENQFNYIRYLQGTLGTTKGADVLQLEKQDMAAREGENDGAGRDTFGDELPMSSDQEIEDVFEDGLKWPASPDQRAKQSTTQQRAAGAQVSYPALTQPAPAKDFQFSSQSLLSQLHENGPSEETGDRDRLQSQAINLDADGRKDGGQPEGPDSGPDDHADDLLDLTVAPPEHGFEFEYSPDRDVEPTETPRQRKNTFEGDDPAETDAARPQDQQHEPIEITSSSSSSSSYHSSQDEDATPTQGRNRGIAGQRVSKTDPGGDLPPDSDDEMEEKDELTPQRLRQHAVETQDIVNAETQGLDLGVPLPADLDEDDDGPVSAFPDELPSSQGHGSVEQEQESQGSDIDFDSWYAQMQFRGFSEANIIRALKCASMNPEGARLILLEESAGKGFPNNVPGIWSEEEDRALESGNAPAIGALAKKHGWDECDARRQFLDDYRSGE